MDQHMKKLLMAYAAGLVAMMTSRLASADDQQPYIVLTPPQPKAMQPFDVDAYFVGPPSIFKIYSVAEELHEIAANDTFTCGDACVPVFEHVHITVPGIRNGTYSLVFRAVGDFPAQYAAFSVTVTTDFVITPGVEGSYFDSEYYGQGFNIEGLANNQLLVYFYTFTPQGQNLFLTGVGNYAGHTATVPLSITTGGRYNVMGAATPKPWGTLTLDFSDCISAEATWTINDDQMSTFEYGSGLPFILSRITSNPNLPCP
jgi:hypothetical protein